MTGSCVSELEGRASCCSRDRAAYLQLTYVCKEEEESCQHATHERDCRIENER